MIFEKCLLLVISGTAVCMDFACSRIDNRWNLIFLVSGTVYQILIRGPEGLLYAAYGAATAFLALFLLFLFRMLGAGDIKLFCALGTILGSARILKCISGAFVFGAVISLIRMFSHGIAAERFRYFCSYVQDCLQSGRITPYRKPGMDRTENMHFTLPVFLSVLFVP